MYIKYMFKQCDDNDLVNVLNKISISYNNKDQIALDTHSQNYLNLIDIYLNKHCPITYHGNTERTTLLLSGLSTRLISNHINIHGFNSKPTPLIAFIESLNGFAPILNNSKQSLGKPSIPWNTIDKSFSIDSDYPVLMMLLYEKLFASEPKLIAPHLKNMKHLDMFKSFSQTQDPISKYQYDYYSYCYNQHERINLLTNSEYITEISTSTSPISKIMYGLMFSEDIKHQLLLLDAVMHTYTDDRISFYHTGIFPQDDYHLYGLDTVIDKIFENCDASISDSYKQSRILDCDIPTSLQMAKSCQQTQKIETMELPSFS